MLSEANAGTRYAVAIGLFAVAVLARLGIDMMIPGRVPFITFFPAVLLATYLCGWGSGLLVLTLSSTAPWWVPAEAGPNAWRAVAVPVFMMVGGLMVWLIDRLERARLQIARQEQQLELINRELQHRIKNLFAITSSIFTGTIRAGMPPDEAIDAVSGRIRSLAIAQEMLGIRATQGAAICPLLNALVKPIAPDPARLKLRGPECQLAAEDTTPFALIVHELATNALKHGAWSGENGVVSIDWHVSELPNAGKQLVFNWSEHNGPIVAPITREELGSRLIMSGLPGDAVSYELLPQGLRCRITLAVP